VLINNFLLESERDSGGTRLPITRAGGHCKALMPAGDDILAFLSVRRCVVAQNVFEKIN
jgi:hypothetical protein